MIDFATRPLENSLVMVDGRRLQRWGVVIVVCSAVGGGCTATPEAGEHIAEAQQDQIAKFVDGQGPLPFDAARLPAYPDDIVVAGMMFDVERFVVPADEMTAQREHIWKHVDEQGMSPSQTAFLAKNGFRMGIANPTEIKTLREALKRLGARSEHRIQTVQSGYPLTLDLGKTGSNQTVFSFRPDGSLQGRTVDAATKYLHIDYQVEIVDGEPRTTLRITPEIFAESQHPQWQEDDGQVRYEKRYQGIRYRELSIELTTAPGEALIVGPADTRDYRFIVGSTILSDETNGRRLETMLCLIPTVYRTQAAQESQE